MEIDAANQNIIKQEEEGSSIQAIPKKNQEEEKEKENQHKEEPGSSNLGLTKSLGHLKKHQKLKIIKQLSSDEKHQKLKIIKQLSSDEKDEEDKEDEEDEEDIDIRLDSSGTSLKGPKDESDSDDGKLPLESESAVPVKLNLEVMNFYKNKPPKLTNDQKSIFNYIDNLLRDKLFRDTNPKVILIEGPVGSGKTEIMKHVSQYVIKTRGKKTGKYIKGNAIVAASTGVAALNYKNGRTAHSTFGFPLILLEGVNDKCKLTEWKENQLRDSSIIVFDEVNMVDNRYIILLDICLKEIMESEEMFGGKIMIFVGDFRLLAPVVDWAGVKDSDVIIEHSPISLDIWNRTKRFTLSTVQRTAGNQDYSKLLLNLGTGRLPSLGKVVDMADTNYIALPNIKFETQLDAIIDYLYPRKDLLKPDLCTNRAILVPRRREMKNINDYIIQNHLDGELVTCESIDTKETKKYITEFEALLDTLNDDKEFPDANLQLKKGCLCMIMRSMYKPKKLLNGTKVIFDRLSEDKETIYVRLPGKSGPTKSIFELKKIWFEVSFRPRNLNTREILKRKQFPLRVCYALTIHKSQGNTYTKMAVDLRINIPPYFETAIFRHGQLLQALSRVKHSRNIKVLVDEKDVRNNTAHTHNVVHPELVSRYIEAENAEVDEPMDTA